MAKLTNCKLNNLDINLNVKPCELSINQSINETVEKKTIKYFSRFRKSVSLLNRLNHRAINAMKLNIPALRHQHKSTEQLVTGPSPGLGLGLVPEHTEVKTQSPNHPQQQVNITLNTTIEYVSEELLYQTPNATMNASGEQPNSAGFEDFRTPMAEMPLPLLLQPGVVLSPGSTYRSTAGSPSYATQYYDSGETTDSDEYPQEDSGDNDSGLEENYHTPRVAKIKSMENLSILEMEFHKASMELDRNSPRRLKQLAEHAQIPKMKSLNNLCFDDYSEEVVREEFQRMHEQSLEQRLRHHHHLPPHPLQLHLHNHGLRKNSTTSNGSSGKLFVKNQSNQAKVGMAKFIGQDGVDTPPVVHHPIQKMRSMGTIPDVLSERIEADPFLTPTSERKPNFQRLVQSAERPALGQSYVNRVLTYDVVDSPADNHQHYVTSISVMSRTPFERAYRRTMQQAAAASTPLATQESSHMVRPHSTNAAYELMRCVAYIKYAYFKENNTIYRTTYYIELDLSSVTRSLSSLFSKTLE